MDINNFSIGVDIETISRFSGLNKKKSKVFLSKIFTEKELDYCFSKKTAAQHLAVRFAAKEALIKAVSLFDKKKLSLNEIEIIKNNDGAPSVNLRGYDIKISLSHCEDKAVAFVLIEKTKL